MSFSSTVKTELCAIEAQDSTAAACLYGTLLALKQFDARAIVMQSGHHEVCRLFSELLRQLFGSDTAIESTFNGAGLYTVSVTDAGDRMRILTYFGHADGKHRLISDNISDDDTDVGAFLRGIFLICGSVTDPNKDYHLELVIPYYNLCGDLLRLLEEHGLALKHTHRKGVYVLYLKESENIEDLLTFMGAVKASLEIMDIKIYKNVRNKVNRVTNCETANIGKTVIAAARQVEDIETIWHLRGDDYLSEDLQELARLRVENPELSLRELGEMLNQPISRSGVNHRMQRIAEIADELRG